MSHVTIRKLNKIYGKDVRAIRDADLEIEKGEFIVLVGPSGCGKTTLLRMIAGLEEVSTGEVCIGGRKVNDLPPAQRDIGMVFQEYALYPHMSVEENLTFGLKVRKTPAEEIRVRVNAAAELLRLGGLLKRKPSELSGGQRQRVAIGRALVKHPSVFLFDEPLSNLDAQLRGQTRIELASLHRRIGSTSIYVTHDQVEAMTLADRIVVLKSGVIQQIGAPMDLYQDPVNRFVASFIGTPGMNFLSGSLDSGKASGFKVFRFEGGEIEFSTQVTPDQNGEMVLGVRPEDVRLEAGGGLQGEVLQIEPHGHEAHVIVRVTPEHTWVVRTTNTKRVEGSVSLKVDTDALHWFESAPEGRALKIRARH